MPSNRTFSGAGSRNVTSLAEFWSAAQAFIACNGGEAVPIEPGSPELKAWLAYFRWLGFRPWMLEHGRIAVAITMPVADPAEFDPSYAAVVTGRKSQSTRTARLVRPLPKERRWHC